MSDFLSRYSIQHWLESCPQGYLVGTEYGHAPGEHEPDLMLTNALLRTESIRTTVQLVVGERCTLAASSGLIKAAPDEASQLLPRYSDPRRGPPRRDLHAAPLTTSG